MPTVKELIDQARTDGARNAATIVGRLLYGPLWDQTLADPIVHRQIMRAGWDEKVRHRLKEAKDTLGGLTGADADQLVLWPKDLRSIIRSINRKGVYVPSLDEFVRLVPESISPPQCSESGRYLIRHGRDSIQRGNRLIRLGELGGW